MVNKTESTLFDNLSTLSTATTTAASSTNNNLLSSINAEVKLTYDIINVLACILFFIGIPPNVAIIYFVLTVRKLGSPINKIVVSLAFADCLYLVWYLVTLMDQMYRFIPFTEGMSSFFYPSLDMFMASNSMVNVAALSVDRLIGCLYPLRYESMMQEKAPRIILFSWSYSIFICLISFVRIAFHNNVYQFIVFYIGVAFSFGIPVVTVVVTYGTIMVCAYKSIKRTKDLHKSVNSCQREEAASESSSIDEQTQRRKQMFSREMKVTIIILVIVLPFTLGWTFYVGVQIYENMTGGLFRGIFFNVLFHLTPSLVSSLNPYIFMLLSKSFRSVIKRKFRNIYQQHPKCAIILSCSCTDTQNRQQLSTSLVQMPIQSNASFCNVSVSWRGSASMISQSKAI